MTGRPAVRTARSSPRLHNSGPAGLTLALTLSPNPCPDYNPNPFQHHASSLRTLGVTPAGYFDAVVHWMPTLLLTSTAVSVAVHASHRTDASDRQLIPALRLLAARVY